MKLFQSAVLSFAALSLLSGCQSVGDGLGFNKADEPNPGPCPAAYALFEAARIVEINGEERLSNIGYTGEINAVRSFCRYFGDRPIIADLEIDFGFGRGLQARSDEHVYEYFVTVTRRDFEVIHKQTFPLRVDFNGSDRRYLTERLDRIEIPRANDRTSGTNFEIIVGFVVTPEQAQFNREGKRFREGVTADAIQ